MSAAVQDTRRPGWLWIDHAVLDTHGATLGPAGIAVYVALASYANQSHRAWPGIRALAAKIAVGQSTVIRELRHLESLGLIRIEKRITERGDQDTNRYVLNRLGGPSQEHPLSPQEQGGVTSGARVVSPQERNKNHLEQEPLNKNQKHCQVAPDDARELLEWVNTLAKTHYQPVETNLRLIKARLRDNDFFTLATMARRQWQAWRGDDKMRAYFRPATLFNDQKCAQYVGQLTDADRAWAASMREKGEAKA